MPNKSEGKTYIGQVVEVLPNGDGLLELDPELVKELGWQVGDELDYQTKDGKIYITNLTRKNNETK